MSEASGVCYSILNSTKALIMYMCVDMFQQSKIQRPIYSDMKSQNLQVSGKITSLLEQKNKNKTKPKNLSQVKVTRLFFSSPPSLIQV